MNEKDRNRLADMLDAAHKAQKFIIGKSRHSLDEDELLALALTRLLEIIGEAARQITEETRDSIDSIPWALVIGMRHRIAHDYLRIDYDVVWDTLTEDLPPLISSLKTLLSSK